MARSSEWLITSAECVVAKRVRASSLPPAPEPKRPEQQPKPEERSNPSPGFGGEHRTPDNDPGQQTPKPKQNEQDQPVGFPQ